MGGCLESEKVMRSDRTRALRNSLNPEPRALTAAARHRRTSSSAHAGIRRGLAARSQAGAARGTATRSASTASAARRTAKSCGRCVGSMPARRTRPGRKATGRSSARWTIAASGRTAPTSGSYCIDACPQQALSLAENPAFDTMGDYRWTPDLLVSTWHMAETGAPPPAHLESEVGDSGGGFDRLRLRFPERAARRPAARRHLDLAGAQPPQRRAAKRSRSTCPGTAAACRSARPTSACCWARPARPRRSTPSPAPARAAIPTASCLTRTT